MSFFTPVLKTQEAGVANKGAASSKSNAVIVLSDASPEDVVPEDKNADGWVEEPTKNNTENQSHENPQN